MMTSSCSHGSPKNTWTTSKPSCHYYRIPVWILSSISAYSYSNWSKTSATSWNRKISMFHLIQSTPSKIWPLRATKREFDHSWVFATYKGALYNISPARSLAQQATEERCKRAIHFNRITSRMLQRAEMPFNVSTPTQPTPSREAIRPRYWWRYPTTPMCPYTRTGWRDTSPGGILQQYTELQRAKLRYKRTRMPHDYMGRPYAPTLPRRCQFYIKTR